MFLGCPGCEDASFSLGYSNSICSHQNLIPLKCIELRVSMPSCLCPSGE